MPVPLSVDLRTRVVEAYEAGQGSQPEVAAEFGVGEASLRRRLRLKRELGSVAPKEHKGGPPPKLGAAEDRLIVAVLGKSCDLTREELADLIAEKRGVRVSVASISRAFKRLRWTRKKSR